MKRLFEAIDGPFSEETVVVSSDDDLLSTVDHRVVRLVFTTLVTEFALEEFFLGRNSFENLRVVEVNFGARDTSVQIARIISIIGSRRLSFDQLVLRYEGSVPKKVDLRSLTVFSLKILSKRAILDVMLNADAIWSLHLGTDVRVQFGETARSTISSLIIDGDTKVAKNVLEGLRYLKCSFEHWCTIDKYLVSLEGLSLDLQGRQRTIRGESLEFLELIRPKRMVTIRVPRLSMLVLTETSGPVRLVMGDDVVVREIVADRPIKTSGYRSDPTKTVHRLLQ